MEEFFVVVEIKTAKTLYTGGSVDTAATRLKPGSCYGIGPNKESALAKAKIMAHRFRSERQCLRCGKWFKSHDPGHRFCKGCSRVVQMKCGPGRGLAKYLMD